MRQQLLLPVDPSDIPNMTTLMDKIIAKRAKGFEAAAAQKANKAAEEATIAVGCSGRVGAAKVAVRSSRRSRESSINRCRKTNRRSCEIRRRSWRSRTRHRSRCGKSRRGSHSYSRCGDSCTYAFASAARAAAVAAIASLQAGTTTAIVPRTYDAL